MPSDSTATLGPKSNQEQQQSHVISCVPCYSGISPDFQINRIYPSRKIPSKILRSKSYKEGQLLNYILESDDGIDDEDLRLSTYYE